MSSCVFQLATKMPVFPFGHFIKQVKPEPAVELIIDPGVYKFKVYTQNDCTCVNAVNQQQANEDSQEFTKWCLSQCQNLLTRNRLKEITIIVCRPPCFFMEKA